MNRIAFLYETKLSNWLRDCRRVILKEDFENLGKFCLKQGTVERSLTFQWRCMNDVPRNSIWFHQV